MNPAFPDFTGANTLHSVSLKVTVKLPTVVTNPISNISGTTATGNGSITDLGIPNPTQYGVVWSTSPNPTIALSTLTTQGAIYATAAFTSSITGLAPGTIYHVRAYATNSAGTAYGADQTFTSAVAPTVTTQPVTGIGTIVAIGNGNIISFGVPNPTQYGVVWSTTSDPTTALSTKTVQGAIALTGPFTSSINGLIPNTLYHVRAYATNSMGTSYGADVTFTSAGPSITTPAPTSLTGFSTFVGTASASQTFNVGGALVGDLVINAPKNYELRESGTPVYVSSISFTPVSGVVLTKTIEIRIAATAPIGTVLGNVECKSTGAITQNVAVNGTVSAIALTASNPVVTLTKGYDGNTSAAVTPGNLSGVLASDAGKVVLIATAVYDNSNVGTGKTITVTYGLTGSAAGN